jgi:hypothetical protein
LILYASLYDSKNIGFRPLLGGSGSGRKMATVFYKAQDAVLGKEGSWRVYRHIPIAQSKSIILNSIGYRTFIFRSERR